MIKILGFFLIMDKFKIRGLHGIICRPRIGGREVIQFFKDQYVTTSPPRTSLPSLSA